MCLNTLCLWCVLAEILFTLVGPRCKQDRALWRPSVAKRNNRAPFRIGCVRRMKRSNSTQTTKTECGLLLLQPTVQRLATSIVCSQTHIRSRLNWHLLFAIRPDREDAMLTHAPASPPMWPHAIHLFALDISSFLPLFTPPTHACRAARMSQPSPVLPASAELLFLHVRALLSNGAAGSDAHTLRPLKNSI